VLKLSSVLDMGIAEDQAMQQYSGDSVLKFVRNLLAEEERFIRIMSTAGY
jgi:hypothetical protein